MHKKIKHQAAIIIGGGIAGLLAARTLCGHFKDIIIIKISIHPKLVLEMVLLNLTTFMYC
jgi:aspartate oxidase